MAEQDFFSAACSVLQLEPGPGRAGGRARDPFLLEVQASVLMAITQAREAVDNEAQPFPTRQVLGPNIGLVAVHIGEKSLMGRPPQHFLDLRAEPQGLGQAPLGRQAGVKHGEAQFRVAPDQGLPPEPS